MHTTLVDVATLATHLHDPNWLIIDCRFDLSKPEAGEAAFRQSHITGAVYAHLDRDLAAPITATTGRHPLPDPQDFAMTLGRWGVNATTQVVAYDADNGMYAARLWWMLRWLGHDAAAVLDGGFKAWLAAGHETSNENVTRTPSQFVAKADRSMWVDASEVARASNDASWRVLDARAPERYRGIVEPIDRVGGHVPGARNHPFAKNVASDGRFAAPGELRSQFDASRNGVPAERTIAMCGSGVTACHLLLALEVAGERGAKLYPGSWSEWIRDPSRPIATNET
ncbi:MAG TPA: sulfurtransferase [Steroidobacteraceae bacterium]|nr:sulfurtransferase [Steroidobacteraceae bacterium]